MVSAAGSDKDGDNQTQRRPGATQQDVGVEHRLGPEVELFTRFDRRINRSVLVVQGDVFQRPRRHDAVIQRGQSQRTVHPEEPQQGVKDDVCPADHAAHRRQRRRDGVHDDLVEVAAVTRQGPRDNAEDGEDQEARDQRGERARYRSRHAVRQSDHPVATDHEGEHFRDDQTDNHTGDDVLPAQPVGADGIGFAHAVWGHGHEGRYRQQASGHRVDFALFRQRGADKEWRHQRHNAEGAVIDVAADSLKTV